MHFSPNVIDVRFRHWSQRFNGVNINSNHASLKNYILWRFNDNPRRDIDCPIRLAHSSLPVWDMLAPPITLFLSDNLNYEEVKIQIWQAGKILASEILTDLPIEQNGTQAIVHIQPLLGKVGFFGKLRLDFALTSPELILQKDTLPEFIWFPNIEVTFEPDPRFPELIACAKLASQSTDLTSMDVTPHLPQTQRLNGEQLGVSAPFQQSMVSCNLVIGDVTVSAEIKLPPLQNCYQDMLWQYQQKLREKQYTFDQSRKIRGQFSKELNQTPERHLLLAEVAYQIGRESRVSLDDAVRHLINYRQACQQLDVIEDTVAVSLDLIICLQRGKLIQSTSGDLQLDTLISRMELVQAYLNTPLQQWAKTIDWDWNYSPLKVLHQSDRVYLDLCLAQAQQNTMMARRKLTKLAKYQTHFFKLELLEARQFLLEGKQSEAQTIYQILRENLSQDSLYQHNFEEIMRFT
ncbi:hypothetical protein CMK12_08805 [Candidatus Poribacteria bacterium]|nr:hypothetical protein [Candidatus Poribacteria bacterium]